MPHLAFAKASCVCRIPRSRKHPAFAASRVRESIPRLRLHFASRVRESIPRLRLHFASRVRESILRLPHLAFAKASHVCDCISHPAFAKASRICDCISHPVTAIASRICNCGGAECCRYLTRPSSSFLRSVLSVLFSSCLAASREQPISLPTSSSATVGILPLR